MTESKATTVRVHLETKDLIDDMEKKINAARKKKKLSPINKMRVLELAMRNLTVDMGVDK